MPNYSLVVDATYDPMTYAEIAAPVKESAAFHQALQDKYDEMRMASEMYGALIPDDEENAEAKRKFNEYMGWLNRSTDLLMKNGAWGQRDMFSQARASYARDMMPVQAAYKLRKDEAAAQQAALAKNPMLEFSHDASSSGLDYYLNHPEGGYKIVDPTTVTGIVAAKAKAFLNQVRNMDDDQAASLEQSMNLPEGYLRSMIRTGLSADRIMNWRNDPVLRSIMSEALGAYNMNIDDNGFGVGNDLWSADATNRVVSAAASGFAAGAGKDDVSIVPDQFMMQAYKNAGKGTGTGTGNGTGYDGPWVRNDHTWTVGDSLTDGSMMETIRNAAAVLGFGSEKVPGSKAIRIVDRGTTFGEGLTDGLPGAIADLIPGTSASTILPEIIKENGWYADGTPFYTRNDPGHTGKNTNIYKDKARKQKVTSADMAAALNRKIEALAGSYHSVQDVSLTSYNPSLQGLKIYPVKKIGKQGTYDVDDKNATTIGAVLSSKDIGSAQVGVSSTATNNGLMLKVTKDGKEKHYFIKTESISDANIRAAIENVNRASQYREQLMKSMGITSDEFYGLAEQAYYALQQDPSAHSTPILNAQIAYRNAVEELQRAIGNTSSASSININS